MRYCDLTAAIQHNGQGTNPHKHASHDVVSYALELDCSLVGVEEGGALTAPYT